MPDFSNIKSFFNMELFDNVMHYLIIGSVAITVAIVGYFVFKRHILKLLFKVIERTKTTWDDELINVGFFDKIAYIIPLLILSYSLNLFPEDFAKPIGNFLGFLSSIIIIISIEKILDATLHIYNQYEISKNKPIKGYIQLAKILLYILGIIIAVCVLVGISPWGVLSGIGALTAVLMFVFKDTILSLVASLQIVANDLFKVGDWIEVPGFGADGDVIDIALHSVKVQNFDKTIVNIPTYKFLDVSVRNWRGMSQSGGRRIKRHINIDYNSIKFLSLEEIEEFKNIEILKEYFQTKEEVVNNYNTTPLNGRKLTNIGTFRAYIKSYLEKHPKIDHNPPFTFLIRQLQPTAEGLPIEIYVFANDNRWVQYEEIQADIFDHLIIASKEFGLRIYQQPTGDFSSDR